METLLTEANASGTVAFNASKLHPQFPLADHFAGTSSVRAHSGTLGRTEHGDPVLLPPLEGVLSDPENLSLPQEPGERSSPLRIAA